jgi:hypothetical protein
MRARLWIEHPHYWRWHLASIKGNWIINTRKHGYTTKRGAIRSAKRLAKKLNIEIVEEGQS